MSAVPPAEHGSLRLRQAVLAAEDLDGLAERLREELGLGEPFSDEGVGFFGLRNVVYALGDTFLEIVSPVQEGTSAGRLLRRRGPVCGYMLMFQLADLAAARRRAAELAVREVFQVSLEDIEEAHLHPVDLPGPIVAISSPRPPEAWRWGGPAWSERATESLALSGALVELPEAETAHARWQGVLGAEPAVAGVQLHQGECAAPALTEIHLRAERARRAIELGAVRITIEEAPPAAPAG